MTLSCSEVQELYETPARTDLVQISGYMTFTPTVQQGTMSITAIDDNEEEGDEEYAVRLLSASGGATVSQPQAATILKGQWGRRYIQGEVLEGFSK